MWVGRRVGKNVKYYFPPPLFELSELNRILFQFFFFCFVFVLFVRFFILFYFSVREPRRGSVWLCFCQIKKKKKQRIKNVYTLQKKKKIQ